MSSAWPVPTATTTLDIDAAGFFELGQQVRQTGQTVRCEVVDAITMNLGLCQWQVSIQPRRCYYKRSYKSIFYGASAGHFASIPLSHVRTLL